MTEQYEVAIFAGGCFWCMVSPFYVFDGVREVTSGYIGGHVANPSYQDVTTQQSGHYEAVRIVFDPMLVSYEKLLLAFWMQVDPTDPSGQFHDRGPSYRTAIFYTTEEQRLLAEKSKSELQNSGRFLDEIVTAILPADKFYPAEDYHQDYFRKNPINYKADRKVSGRDAFIKKHWGEDYWKMFG